LLIFYVVIMIGFFEMHVLFLAYGPVLLILVVACVSCGVRGRHLSKLDVGPLGQFGYVIDLGLGLGADGGSVPHSKC
jgi:hypothetical protein